MEEKKQRMEDRKRQRKEDRRNTFYRQKEEEAQRIHEEQLKKGEASSRAPWCRMLQNRTRLLQMDHWKIHYSALCRTVPLFSFH